MEIIGNRNVAAFLAPDTLAKQALNVLVDNYQSIFMGHQRSQESALPSKISNALLEAYQQKNLVLSEDFLKIFDSPNVGNLTEIRLRECSIAKKNKNYVSKLVTKKVRELNLQVEDIPENFLSHLNDNADCLEVFNTNSVPLRNMIKRDIEKSSYILKAQNLKTLIISYQYTFIDLNDPELSQRLFKNLETVTYLDLSGCRSVNNTHLFHLSNLPNLTSLVLFGLHLIGDSFQALKLLNNLEHLDISSSFRDYRRPGQILRSLIESLPNLKSLDISGTNLDKMNEAEEIDEDEEYDGEMFAPFFWDLGLNRSRICPFSNSKIFGLSSRISNPLDFLGLYQTRYQSCYWENIPAKEITGHANLKQLLNAAVVYSERNEILINVFENIKKIEHLEEKNIYLIFDIALESVEKHLCCDECLYKVIFDLLESLLKKHDLCFSVRIKVLKTVINIGIRLIDNNHRSYMAKSASRIILAVMKSPRELDCLIQPLIDFMLTGFKNSIPNFSFALKFSQNSQEKQKLLFIEQGGMEGMMKSVHALQSVKSLKTKYQQHTGIPFCHYLLRHDMEQFQYFWETIGNLTDNNFMFSEKFLKNGVQLFSIEIPVLMMIMKPSIHVINHACKVFVQIMLQFETLSYYLLSENFIKCLREMACFNFKDSAMPNFYARFILTKLLSKRKYLSDIDTLELLQFLLNYDKILNHKLRIDDKLIDPLIELIQENKIAACQFLGIWGLFNVIRECQTEEKKNSVLQKAERLENVLKNFIMENKSSCFEITKCAEIIFENIKNKN